MIYCGSRGIGLIKNLHCSLVFEQNLQFKRVGDGSISCLARLSKHGSRINNTILDFKAAKESIFYVVLTFYIKNSKKQYWLWVIKVNFHVFACYGNIKSRFCSLYSIAHLCTDQLNFSSSIKIAKTCRRGQVKSLCLNRLINSASYEYCELE